MKKKKEEEEKEEFKLKEGQSALKNFVREYIIDGKPGCDPQAFFESVRSLILKILRENKNTKVKMILNCKMQRTDLRTGKIDEVVADFHSQIEINLEGTDKNELLNEMIVRIEENIANFQRRGSNWQFVSINQLEIHLVDFIPLGGSSYIPLPKTIRDKKYKFDFSAKMIFTAKDQSAFENAKICWICRKEFGESKKVRDHCHFTGKFRGAAHNICNLQFKKPKFTPVIFHNLSGYDAHLFVKNLGKTEGNIKCIPNNEEKYISFSKDIVVDEYTNKKGEKIEIIHEIRFLDSFKFMTSSLENLVRNLAKSDLEKLKETEKSFGDGVKLLSRKGIYPYDYMSKIEKFSETQLPPKEDFYSKLNDCGVSDDDYNHAKKVWKEFGIKNLGEYHDLYLQSDVLLLADVFEEFRNVCIENYSLDPAWYYTSPGLSWDALLKHSGVRLELLTDPDMLLMFEKGIRGGVSMIPNRFGKADNKFMEKSLILRNHQSSSLILTRIIFMAGR